MLIFIFLERTIVGLPIYFCSSSCLLNVFTVLLKIPEAEASIQDIAMDPEGSYMAAVNNRGHCYIWSLTGGVGEEPTKLNPKHKIEAHQRYALKCKFSPDST